MAKKRPLVEKKMPTAEKMPPRYRVYSTTKGCRIYDRKIYDYVKGEDGQYLLFVGHEEKLTKGRRFVSAYDEAQKALANLT